jgi:hypothetical protein
LHALLHQCICTRKFGAFTILSVGFVFSAARRLRTTQRKSPMFEKILAAAAAAVVTIVAEKIVEALQEN